MRLMRPIEIAAKEIPWIASNYVAAFNDPAASAFCDRLVSGGFEADLLVRVLPSYRLIYITAPKAASTPSR